MRKKNILVVLLVALFAFIPFVNAEELNANSTISVDGISYEEATIPKVEPTTKGISYEGSLTYSPKEWAYIVEITYTITSDYDIKESNGTINLNVSADFFENNHFNIQPGDATRVYITIVNQTSYKFSYVDKSLVIATEDLSEGYKEDEAGFEGFDGNKINVNTSLNINRTASVPLKELLGYRRLHSGDYTDAEINTALLNVKDAEGNQIYPNGIDDLDKYYLNYFSALDNTTYNSLYELPEKDVVIIFGGAFKGEGQGNRLGMRESNLAVAKLGYDFFNNNLFTVFGGDTKEVSDQDSKYSLGSYMRDEAPSELNDQLKEAFNEVEESTTLIKTKLNGPRTTNSYQAYGFGLQLAFQVAAPSYKVYTNFVDVNGKVLADQVAEFNKYTGEDYITYAKDIEGYELVRVDGEKSGVIQDKDVVVTYVYEFVMGEGGEEEKEVVQTGSEIDYSLMSSALITISLIGIALYSKKKNN